MSHILIIEDEPFMALQIEDVLRGQGADSFDIAVSQADAVDAAVAHHPDLITSDVRLVEGNGPAAVRQIQERLGRIPVIFVTGTPEDCTGCDPDDIILSKPLDQAAMTAAFRKISGRPQ